MSYQVAAAVAGSVIAITFLVVALILLYDLLRTRQVRGNPLGTLMVILFLGVAVHRGLLVLAAAPQFSRGSATLIPVNLVLDGLTALLGLMFLALRSQYGAIVLAPPHAPRTAAGQECGQRSQRRLHRAVGRQAGDGLPGRGAGRGGPLP